MINRTTHGTPGDDAPILTLHARGQAGCLRVVATILGLLGYIAVQPDGTDDLSLCFTGGGTWTGGKFTQLHKPAFDPRNKCGGFCDKNRNGQTRRPMIGGSRDG